MARSTPSAKRRSKRKPGSAATNEGSPPLAFAIVGRPNVGKSTLLNRLVGRSVALVHDAPGVTRDWRESEARWGDIAVQLFDTPGLEEAEPDSLESRMREQAQAAINRADQILFVYDARAGVTPYDSAFADWLRRQSKPITLLANKCEGRAANAGLAEGHALGLGDPLPISAEHNEGISVLIAALIEAAQQHRQHPGTPAADTKQNGEDHELKSGNGQSDPEALDLEDEAQEAQATTPPVGRLTLAVVGRPNAGKSTFINALLGEARMLTGAEAGITRDAIALPFEWKDRAFSLVDTAGLRRKARIHHSLETLSASDTLRAIRYADLVVLMVDATEALEKQDLNIARYVVDEGRGLIIAVNKWDLVRDRKALRQQLEARLDQILPQVRGVPLVTISALQGRQVGRVMQAALDVEAQWRKRVSTGPLNRWIQAEIERHPPPLVRGVRIKIRYLSQVSARPPTFVLFGTKLDALPTAYERFIVNGLRERFDLWGTPIRLLKRNQHNPYAPSQK